MLTEHLGRLRRLVLDVVNLPAYWVSKIVPKRDTWVFGAWMGRQYSDNPRCVFEYVTEKCTDVRAVWLTRDSSIVSLIRSRGGLAYRPESIQGYLHSMRAVTAIIGHGAIDINPYVVPPVCVNLWHGFPIKKIGLDDEKIARDGLRRVASALLPFRATKCTAVCAASRADQVSMASAFNVPLDHVHLTGYPRNDRLVDRPARPTGGRALYLPTFRDRSSYDPFADTVGLGEVGDRLDTIGYTLLVKPHPAQRWAGVQSDTTRVEVLPPEQTGGPDLYEVLNDVDILVTDYSSVYVDFLNTGRPIIFAPFDLESYLALDRSMYYPYEEVTPGPRCRSWSEVGDWIIRLASGDDPYLSARESLRERFQPLGNGATERCVQLIGEEVAAYRAKRRRR